MHAYSPEPFQLPVEREVVHILVYHHFSQQRGGRIALGDRHDRYCSCTELVRAFPLGRMPYYFPDIKPFRFIHEDLGHFLSGKKNPFLFIIPFRINMLLPAFQIFRERITDRTLSCHLFTGDDRLSGSLQLLFCFRSGFRFFRQHVKTFKIQPSVLCVRFDKLFRFPPI